MPLPMSYLKIADDFAARIKSGEYQPGQQPPWYNELATLYSVRFSTITRAIGVPGRGVFVPEV